MDDFISLTLLSLAMLVGSYVAGSVPLVLTLSEKRLRLITSLGAGLLIGTALAVIIPEGVHALYTDHGDEHSHENRLSENDQVQETNIAAKPDIYKIADMQKKLSEENDHHHAELHSYIGIALCTGFVFMLLIDQLGGSHAHGGTSDGSSKRGVTATIGLVVHAAADGIAMGAAANSSNSEVAMLVFIAIMLHKAPAAFGLASFLLHEGYQRNKIRRHLLIFSLAAPVMALVTYAGLSRRHKQLLSSINGTGIALLFSAGTFLYVATVHVLKELTERHGHESPNAAAASGIEAATTTTETTSQTSDRLSKEDLTALILGIVFPMIISIYHQHEH
ncbi:zinc transporter ZIP9-like [Oscarella lobularis]|uniref:zinc transporter ZIP9-like n=1 Tax=Oscarella lobularis TaxID=121494 RepID=UPI003314013E